MVVRVSMCQSGCTDTPGPLRYTALPLEQDFAPACWSWLGLWIQDQQQRALLSPAPDGVQGICRGRKKLSFTQKVSKRGEGKGVRKLGMENSK